MPCMVFFRGCSCSCSEGRTPSNELEDNNATYTVLFYTNSAQAFGYNRQEVAKGKYVTRPDDPIRNDYVFKNWYITMESASDCANPETDAYIFDFFQPVYTDLALYAGWIPRSY